MPDTISIPILDFILELPPEYIFIPAMIWALIVTVFLIKFLTRLKKGSYDCEALTQNTQTFKTDYGTFTIDGRAKQLNWKNSNGDVRTIAFGSIQGIELSIDEDDAFAEEFLLTGWNWTDIVIPEYIDKNVTRHISLVLNNQTSGNEHNKIPLFVAKQYEIRDLIPVNELLLDFLESFSLHKDAEIYTYKVLSKIIAVFEGTGKKLDLLGEATKNVAYLQ